MRCEFCKNDIGNTIVLLPEKKEDGCLNTMVCLKCAEKSSAYCKKHKRPHLGFADDDTTACALCIEEMVARKKFKDFEIFETLTKRLLPEEREDLLEWADLSASVTGDSPSTCVLRAIVTKAFRRQVSIEEILKEILEAKSANIILPKVFI